MTTQEGSNAAREWNGKRREEIHMSQVQRRKERVGKRDERALTRITGGGWLG